MAAAGISQRRLCRHMNWSRGGYWSRIKKKQWFELFKKDAENLQLLLKKR